MLTIYALAALPFFTGGLVVTLAISRLSSRINAVYAADLIGAAAGCLVLIPLLDRLGAPASCSPPPRWPSPRPCSSRRRATRARVAAAGVVDRSPCRSPASSPASPASTSSTPRDTRATASCSASGIRSRASASTSATHGDWSLSPAYNGPLPDTRFMDIDSAASTPILAPRAGPLERAVPALRADGARLSAEGAAGPVHARSVIGPGGGRDLASALVFGAAHVDGVEINPIIANDVMRGRFREFSGGIYTNPRVRIAVDDGRSFVRRTPDRYDVIQASLVDTWAATAAGAYTLTENTLYTVEAFNDYLDHLTDDGVLTITRWVFDGLRLVSLAQAACERAAGTAADRAGDRPARPGRDVPAEEVAVHRRRRSRGCATIADRLRFRRALRAGDAGTASAPARADDVGRRHADRRLRAARFDAADRAAFYASYPQDIRPTTDDRPFFFHTTKLQDQFQVAFGRSMLFGNGLSALLTLMGISAALVVLFVSGRWSLAERGGAQPRGWLAWLVVFRRARRRLHADRGVGAAAVRAAARPSGVLADGDAVLAAARHRARRGVEPALRRRDAAAHGRAARSSAIARRSALARDRRRDAAHRPGRFRFARRVRIADRRRRCSCRSAMVLGIPMPAGIRLLRARAPADGDLGLGHERRAVGGRRDAGDLHRDELGLPGHAAGRLGAPTCVGLAALARAFAASSSQHQSIELRIVDETRSNYRSDV